MRRNPIQRIFNALRGPQILDAFRGPLRRGVSGSRQTLDSTHTLAKTRPPIVIIPPDLAGPRAGRRSNRRVSPPKRQDSGWVRAVDLALAEIAEPHLAN